MKSWAPRRRGRFTAALAALALAVAACGSDDGTASSDGGSTDETAGPSEGEPTAGGEFTWAMTTFPESIDPLQILTGSGSTVALSIFDSLLTMDDAGELQPLLASDFSTPDDGKTWVLDLQEGVTFHDDSPFDAAAVVAHLERLMDPDNACTCASDAGRIESVEATGDLEVTINLKAQSVSFPAALSGQLGLVTAPSSTPDQPIGAGPFVFVESRQDDQIVVERNPDYWQEGLPYLDRVVFKSIPDAATRAAALETGEIDMYWETSYQRWSEIRESEELQLIPYGGFGSYYILLNNTRPPFDDLDARLAIAKALDLETMHETLSGGEVEPATSIFPRGSWAYPGEIESYPAYDLDGAKDLVESLGGLEFSLLAPVLTHEQAVVAQGMFEEAGMKVQLEPGENLAVIEKVRNGEFDAVAMGFSASTDPLVFASGYASDSPRNWAGYASEDMDALIRQADTTVDRAERAGIFAQIAELAAKDLPFILINNYNDAWAARADVHGVVATPDGNPRLNAVWVDR